MKMGRTQRCVQYRTYLLFKCKKYRSESNALNWDLQVEEKKEGPW